MSRTIPHQQTAPLILPPQPTRRHPLARRLGRLGFSQNSRSAILAREGAGRLSGRPLGDER